MNQDERRQIEEARDKALSCYELTKQPGDMKACLLYDYPALLAHVRELEAVNVGMAETILDLSLVAEAKVKSLEAHCACVDDDFKQRMAEHCRGCDKLADGEVRKLEATVAKYRGLEDVARNWYINDRSVESFKAFAAALAALEGK